MVVWHDLKVGKQNPHHIFRASYSLQDYIPGRAVHSASHNLICERRTETPTCARAFGVVAPNFRHDLPVFIQSSDAITSFKNNLTIYLFNQSFTS